MQSRFEDYQTCFAALNFSTDVQNNIANYVNWCLSWNSYVKDGGDRPPIKPNHP